MKSTTLGSLNVSQMQLGAMYFGSTTPEAVARSLLDRFVDAGGTFIDTSNNYSFWVEGGRGEESENLLGRWLKDRGRRDDLVIATKVGAKPSIPEAGLTDVQGLTAAVIENNIDESLARLGTDHIDLYYAHVDDRKTPLEETLTAFDRLIKAGKVREIACSNYVPWRIEEARQISLRLGLASYIAVQARHSYFQPKFGADFGIQSALGPGDFGMEHSADAHLFDFARARPGFRIIAYSPLLQGGYVRPDRLRNLFATADNARRRVALDEVADATGASVNQIVLAWMMQSEQPVLPIIAASSMTQLDDNLGAANLVLSAEHMTQLDQAV